MGRRGMKNPESNQPTFCISWTRWKTAALSYKRDGKVPKASICRSRQIRVDRVNPMMINDLSDWE